MSKEELKNVNNELNDAETKKAVPSDAAVVETFSAILKEYGENRTVDGEFKTIHPRLKRHIPAKFHKSEIALAFKFLQETNQIQTVVNKKTYGNTSGTPKKTFEDSVPVITPRNKIRHIKTKEPNKVTGFVRQDKLGYYLEPLGKNYKLNDKKILLPIGSDAKNHLDKLVEVNLYDRLSYFDATISKTLEGGEYVSKLIALVMGLAANHDIYLNPDQKTLDSLAEELAEIPEKVTENDPKDKWSIANMKKEYKSFQDLRHLPFSTIDPATCLDMDDSVCVIKNPDGGYTEYVAISLVSVYLKTFGALFNYALDKGNSTYIADFVDPMMREKLSNIIGSLNANEDRLAFITKIDYDKNGNIENEEMFPGVMRSRHKFAYEDVDKIISNDLSERNKHPEDLLASIDALRQLEDLIRPQREAEGSTKFATREYTSRLTEDRANIKEQFADNSTKAHEMIETAMLTANEVFARFAMSHEIPIVYRVEDSIEENKIEEIRAFLGKMGVPFHLADGAETHSELQNAINEAVEFSEKKKGPLFAQVVSEGIIKCLPKARYDTENVGHFALNFDAYAHTTSPIRRFADLVSQKQVLAYMSGKPLPFTKAQLDEMCEHINYTERNSGELEMEVQELLNAWNINQQLQAGKDLSCVGFVSKIEKGQVIATTDYGHIVIDIPHYERDGELVVSQDRLSIINSRTQKVLYHVGQELNVKPTMVDISTSTIKATAITQEGYEQRDSHCLQEMRNFYKSNDAKSQSSNIIPYEKLKPVGKKGFVIIHNHTSKSDGRMSYQSLLYYGAHVTWPSPSSEDADLYIGPADHEYMAFARLKELFGIRPKNMANAYIPVNGAVLGKEFEGRVVKLVNACEFTCFDNINLDKKGRMSKFHLLIVGGKLDKINPFLKLLAFSRQNDINYDLARVEYIFRYRGVKYPADLVNAFKDDKYMVGKSIKQFTPDLAKEFFSEHPDLVEQLKLSRTALDKLIDAVPTVEKIKVPIDLVIKAAHDCGSLVLVAHPAKNLMDVADLRQSIKGLLSLHVDGFNLKEAENVAINSAIRYYTKNIKTQNPMILDAGGPDCHSLQDYKNADNDKFSIEKSPTIISELEELQKARLKGKLSHRKLHRDKNIAERVDQFIESNTLKNDPFATFTEAANEIMAIEKLKSVFFHARNKAEKDSYFTKSILTALSNEPLEPEIYGYLKSQECIDIKTLYTIINGTFVIPKSKEGSKESKRNMVSKRADKQQVNNVKTNDNIKIK